MFSTYLLDILYLIASITFVVGLRMLSHPDSARRGNQVAAVGMGLAVLGTLFFHPSVGLETGQGHTTKLLTAEEATEAMRMAGKAIGTYKPPMG